jgi:hypothetical protein
MWWCAAPPLPQEYVYPTLLLVLTTSPPALMMLLVDLGLFLGEQFTQNFGRFNYLSHRAYVTLIRRLTWLVGTSVEWWMKSVRPNDNASTSGDKWSMQSMSLLHQWWTEGKSIMVECHFLIAKNVVSNDRRFTLQGWSVSQSWFHVVDPQAWKGGTNEWRKTTTDRRMRMK